MTRFAAVAPIALLFAIQPAVAATVFTDGSFAPADYALTTYTGTGNTSFGQNAAAGNPGSGLLASYKTIAANPKGLLFVAINTSFVYDPLAQGAITSIDASLDRSAEAGVDGEAGNIGSYSLRVFAQQGANLYQAIYLFPPFNQPGGSYYSFAQSGILASDFKLFDPVNYDAAGVTTGLDFSGGAITFGFAMRAAAPVDGNGNPVAATATGRLKADNFSITVNAVPEPATWGMMILGFGLAGGAMRRARTTRAFA